MPTDVAAARRRFDDEQKRFRSTVIAAVGEGQRKTDVAADAKISRPALDSWLKAVSQTASSTMSSKDWNALEWIENSEVVTSEFMWREAVTRRTYIAESPRGEADEQVKVRRVSRVDGVIVGDRPEFGEVSLTSGGLPQTRIETATFEGEWKTVHAGGGGEK